MGRDERFAAEHAQDRPAFVREPREGFGDEVVAERSAPELNRTGEPDRGQGRDAGREQGRGDAAGAPRIPDDIEASDLDKEVRAELLSLSKPVADTVARHLVAAGQLIEDDVEEALAHAMAARRMASRIAAVREAVGLAAYAAGEWQTAIAEVRTYHRMTGRQNHLAVLADCERALGRPEKAIDLFRTADREKLAREDAIELLIVAAGARTDLGQHEAAVAMLQVKELTNGDDEWAARLRYAYADSLLAAGRPDEARAWFARTAEIDEESLTDAAERLLEMDGVQLEDDFDEDEDEDGHDDVDAYHEQPGSDDEPAARDDADADDVEDEPSARDGEVEDDDDYDDEPLARDGGLKDYDATDEPVARDGHSEDDDDDEPLARDGGSADGDADEDEPTGRGGRVADESDEQVDGGVDDVRDGVVRHDADGEPDDGEPGVPGGTGGASSGRQPGAGEA